MRSFFIVLRYEFFLLFISPSTYIASFYFITLLGIGFKFFLEVFSYSDWILPPLSSLVVGLFFGAPALIPFLTMRSFAEERKLGTLETLLTTPTNIGIIVLGKWVACFSFYLIICALSFLFPLILIYTFPEQSYNLGFHDYENWIGCTVFLIIYGASFTAIGIFSSTITKSQMVAGMLSFTLITVYISIMALSINYGNHYSENDQISKILIDCIIPVTQGLEKLEQFSVGFIDFSTILHQLVLTIFFLVLSSIQISRLYR